MHQPDPDPAPHLQPARSLDASRFNEIMHLLVHESPTALESAMCVNAVYASVVPLRAPLDSLMFRAHHETEMVTASHGVAHELYRRVTLALESVTQRITQFAGDDPIALELFARAMNEHVCGMLRDVATDAVVGEALAIARLLDHADTVAALDVAPLSTVSLVLVLLGDGRTSAARRGLWTEPLAQRREPVVNVARMMSEREFRVALQAHARVLGVLHRQLPADRWRAMVVRPERGTERRAARPGLGYLGTADVARLCGTSLRAVRSRISRTTTACALAYADPAISAARIATDRLPTAAWVDHFLEGQ